MDPRVKPEGDEAECLMVTKPMARGGRMTLSPAPVAQFVDK